VDPSEEFPEGKWTHSIGGGHMEPIRPSDVILMRGFRGVGRTSAIQNEGHLQPLSIAVAAILRCRSWGPPHLAPTRTTAIADYTKVKLESVRFDGHLVIGGANNCRYIVTVSIDSSYDMVWWVNLDDDRCVHKVYLRAGRSVQQFAWEGEELLGFLREV
jgi:hypothetical protein